MGISIVGSLAAHAAVLLSAASSFAQEPGPRPTVPSSSKPQIWTHASGAASSRPSTCRRRLPSRQGRAGYEVRRIDRLYNGEQVYLCAEKGNSSASCIQAPTATCEVPGRPHSHTRDPASLAWSIRNWAPIWAG